MIHVLPVDDTIKHINSTCCACCPRLEKNNGNPGWIINEGE